MAVMLDLEDTFGHGGPLQSSLPDFKVRWQQLRMAERVAAALQHRETLVLEAGTGTGKTFAYLVPALLCGARVLISTGTRTLQDQLFSKDLPLVAAAALLERPAARRRGFGQTGAHRLAEGAYELPVPLSDGGGWPAAFARLDACRGLRRGGWHARPHRALGADDTRR